MAQIDADAVTSAIVDLRREHTPQSLAEAVWLDSVTAYYRERNEYALAAAQEAAERFAVLRDREGHSRALALMGDSLRHLNRYDEALDGYEKALAMARGESGHERAAADALCGRAEALRKLDRRDEAMATNDEALALAREIGDRRIAASAVGFMGVVLCELDRYDEALARCEEALALAREIGDLRIAARNIGNLGVALGLMSRNDEALARCEEALALAREIGDRRATAWALMNGAAALRLLNQYEQAAARSEEALALAAEIEDRDLRAHAAFGIAQGLEAQGRGKKAAERFRDAARLYRELGDESMGTFCQSRASSIEGRRSDRKRRPEQSAVDEFFRAAADEVPRLLDKMDRSDKERDMFLERVSGVEDRLIFAREWNSWQPLVPGERRLRGGGYLLRWAGKGLAIDPGPGFLANLNEGGFGLADIDAVIVTHNHIDHVAELPHILTLVHEYNELHPNETRRIDLFLAPSVLQAYVAMAATSKDVGRFERLVPGRPVVAAEYSLEVVPYEAKHTELGGTRNSISIALQLLTPDNRAPAGAVALTGDTGWHDDLAIAAALGDLPRPLVMVAHLGSVYPEDGERFNPSHLGYRGMAALMYRLKESNKFPDRLAISEFGIECKPLVAQIVSSLAKRVDEKDSVCDGTLGRTILLPSGDVACDDPEWCAGVCCRPSTHARPADDRTHFIFRCDDHWLR